MTQPTPLDPRRPSAPATGSRSTLRRPWGALTAHVGAWSGRHRRGLGLAGAGVSTGMAVLWTVVVPDRADQVGWAHELAIRWSHPATWVLLAALGVLVAAGAPKPLRSAAAWASLACYAVFVLALVI